MVEENKIPEIRFEGFGGEWEERRFGECVLIQRGGSPRPIENFITNDENGINWIKIGDVSVGSRYITKTKQKIVTEGEKHSRKVQKGDLILSNSMSFGRPYIMAIDGCIHDGWLLIHDEKEMFDVEYLLQLLSSDYMLNQYRALAAGGVVINLNSELVQSTNVFIPHPNEQTKIGNYFQLLDTLISLHQKKHDKLLNVKKAMLEKMFPKKGADVPEIRFKGFSEKWEERKLGADMNITSVKRIHQSDWTDSGIRFLRARDIVSAYKNDEPSDYLYITKEKYAEYSLISGKVKQGDLLVTGVGTIGIPMLITNDNPIYFKDGNIIWFQNENKITGNFLYYSFINNGIQSYINDSAGIGTVGTYTIESGKKTPIMLPNQEEQTKIGNFFKNIDTLLTLHQSELEKLKNIKKACLEKMFV